MKLAVPVTNGEPIEVSGRKVGPFLVHEPANGFCLEWHVTHIASRIKFPCAFETREQAVKFARAARSVMDWSAVKVEPVEPGSVKTKWVSGAPTLEQRATIKDLMRLYADCRSQ